jgi:hypothetical protein
MTKWISAARCAPLFGVLVATTSCGGSDDAQRAADAAERAADAAQEAAEAARAAATAAQAAVQLATQSANVGQSTGAGGTSSTTGTGGSPAVVTVRPPTGPGIASACVAPPGVSTTPATIPEALGLLNSLPKPTTIECFLQTLSRPLALYLTSSTQSLQPATGGARSPRTFVLRGALEMSIVLDGPASSTLELAYRPVPGRSIKTEILFPLAKDVTPERFFDRVVIGGNATECGNCHVAETQEAFDGFPEGVFVSDVIPPYAIFEVSLDSLRNERATCDEQAEPQRCSLLSALLDFGDVQSGQLGNAGL